MGFPFTRIAYDKKACIGPAHLVGHILATGSGLVLFNRKYGGDLHLVWQDIADEDFFFESIGDLVVMNCVRSMIFIFMWTFTVGWHVGMLSAVVAFFHVLGKCALAPESLVGYGALLLVAVSILSILLDIFAMTHFAVTDDDPDVSLLQPSDHSATQANQPNSDLGTPLRGTSSQIDSDAPSRPRGMVLRTLIHFTSPDIGLLTMGSVLMFLSMGSQLLIPGFTGRCLEGALRGEHDAAFHDNLAGLVIICFACAFFSATRIWNTAKLEVRLVCRVQRILFHCILQQDVSYFDTMGTGQLTSRISSDAQMLAQIMTTNINLVLQKSIILVGSLAFMFTLNAYLAVAYVAVALSFFLFTRWFGQLTKSLQTKIQSVTADANQVAMQAVSGIRTVRASAAEEREREHYDTENRRLLLEQLRLKMCWTCYAPLVSTIANVLTLLVLIMGSHFVATGDMRSGDLAAFLFQSQMVQDAMNTVASQIVAVYQGLGAGQKIFEIIAAPPPKVPLEGGAVPSDSDLKKIDASTPLLEFREVVFRFPDKQINVLKGLSLAVKFRETLGIVGESGSGKSTLVSLALRFYDPQQGSVHFRGLDVRGLNPRWLRHQIASVPQDPMLFDTTVRENVAYAKPDASDEDIGLALQRADAEEFVMRLGERDAAPREVGEGNVMVCLGESSGRERAVTLGEALASRVGERGVTLSGGQKQRLALARALLLRPSLLVFDEATSALDNNTEAKVQKSVLDLHRTELNAGRGFSMLVVAHRLSTVQELDEICVVKQGKVAERGTHKALLAENGIYAGLVQKRAEEEQGEEPTTEHDQAADPK
eukprot:TRINITY_DN57505_c0_g1_i1.p1 TRINITY_DN57505_c0_g1~~TRINITY_DN57505_c0_g1_i1.p1  ORF type:complete len:822 (-),score=132.96 TRINITY_DN57505_c0_g1_i1:25-2490(-)